MKMKIFLSLVFSVCFLFFASTNINANNGSFIENFNGKKIDNKWNIIAGENNIILKKGIFSIANSGNGNIPYMVTKDIVFPQNDSYVLKIRFAYPYSGYYGNGIFGSYKNEQGDLLDAFRIWHVAGRQIEVSFWHENFNIPWDTNFHTVKLAFKKDRKSSSYVGKIALYFDDKLLYSSPSYDRKFEYIEVGARPFTPTVLDWNVLSLDYIKITDRD